MKLRQILSSVPVPTSSGLPEARGVSPGYGQAPFRALEQAGQQIASTASQVSAIEAQAQQRRRQLEEQSEALTLLTEAELEAKDFQFNLERQPDYKTHTANYQKGFQEITKRTLARTKNPNIKAILQQRMARLGLEGTMQARTFEEKHFVDSQVASLENNLTNLRQLAARGSPEELAKYTGLGVGAIRGAAQGGLISAVKAGDRERDFLSDVSLEVAKKEISANPDAFLKEADEYRHIDPLKLQHLKEQAGNESERRVRQAERDRAAQEREAEKARKAWQSQNSIRLAQQLRAGQANAGTVMSMASRGEIDENDQRFYLSYIDTQGRRADAAADRAQRERHAQEDRADRNMLGTAKMMLATGDLDPETAMRLAKSGKFSGRLAGDIAEEAVQTKNAQRTEVSAEVAEQRRQFSEMVKEVKDGFFGPSNSFNKKVSDQVEQLASDFQSHARTLSKAWNTSNPDAIGDPWEIKKQIIDEYNLRYREIVKGSNENTRLVIPQRYRPERTPDGRTDFASIQQKLSQLKEDATAGRITRGEYTIQAERLRELANAEAARDRAGAGTGTGSGSSSGISVRPSGAK